MYGCGILSDIYGIFELYVVLVLRRKLVNVILK